MKKHDTYLSLSLSFSRMTYTPPTKREMKNSRNTHPPTYPPSYTLPSPFPLPPPPPSYPITITTKQPKPNQTKPNPNPNQSRERERDHLSNHISVVWYGGCLSYTSYIYKRHESKNNKFPCILPLIFHPRGDKGKRK